MSINLSTCVGTLSLKNPVMTASGTSGHSDELSPYFSLDKLGAFVTKGISAYPKQGNPTPRISETPGGMLNSIGLENPGTTAFVKYFLPKIKNIQTPIICNFFGNDLDSYIKAASELSSKDEIAALELNISCPNVKSGGILFGSNIKIMKELIEECKKVTNKPLIVKLSPNNDNVVKFAEVAIDAGADALTCFNTLLGTDIDIFSKKFVLGAGKGGLSGPAILPVTLLKTYEIAKAFPEIPIIGTGGISSGTDAFKYLLAGSSAVQVGTMTLAEPTATMRIINEIKEIMVQMGISSINEIIGEVSQV